MNTTRIASVACRLAVCPEFLGDGHEWSICAVNAVAQAVDLIVERADWEWGDMGHARKPGTRFSLPAKGVARILRVDGTDAEMSMSVTLVLTANDTQVRQSFRLGKLYLYRNPELLEMIALPGWLRTADEYQRL